MAKDMADFRISEAAGPDAPLIFARKHGQPLNKGIPGLYTYAGYQKVFSQDSPRLIAKLAEESWILGKEEQLSLAPATVQKLTDEVRELYLKDYVRQWEALLADLDVRSLPNLQQAVEVLRVMSAPDSPLRRLLEAVEKETVLDRRPRDPPAQEEKGTSLTDRFRQFFKETPAPAASEGAPASRPESTVARHFEELHRLVQAPEGKPAPIESTLEVLNQLYVYLNGLASAADRGKSAVEAAKGTGNAAVTSVKLAASRQPAPVNRWLNDVADDAIAITVGGARSELNALWASEVLPFCRKAISDRYPLSRTSRQEVTLEDFGYFFGPDGLMDSFFKQQLEPFVGTGSRNALGISADALRQFQRAATIKEYFFRAAGKTPSVRFDLKPVALDAKVRQFLLDLDGQLIEYRHGPPRPARVQWPGPEGPGQVRIVFEDLQGNRPSMTEDGPWAWFRVLDQSAMEAADHPDRFRVTFSLGGYRASFELLPSSVLNPFQLQALTEFHCPERL